MRKHVLYLAALLAPLLLTALTGVGQTVTNPSLTSGYDMAKSGLVFGNRPAPTPAVNSGSSGIASGPQYTGNGCFIPADASYTTLGRNDDGSFGPIALPFTFRLYGSSYTQVWINTNGNLTFQGPFSSFSSSGFPSGVPMVAPFWSDVDTRNPASGLIHYKLSPTNLIVTWDNVGYYGTMADKLSTFQAIIGSETDALLGPGQNVSLRYGDMQWTTGLASGGVGGFMGIPATVGVNNGNNLDYVQVGRFNLNNSDYDGPGGAHDGVNYLDGQCFGFNVGNAGNAPPSANNMPLNNTVTVACGQTVTLDPRFLGPEVNQTVTVGVNTNGLCNTSVTTTNGTIANAHIVITGTPCNVGTHPIILTATDNGSPTGITTVTLNVVVVACCNLQLAATPTPVACPGGTDGALDLTVSNATAPLTYRWSNGATTQDLTGVPPGTYTVTVTEANGCTATASYSLGQQDTVNPTARTRNITLPLNTAGAATLTPANVDNGSTDNCIFTLALNRTAFDCSNLGPNTVTLTVTDGNGNVGTATATVTVVDVIAPTVRTRPATVYLNAAGQASLTAGQVNDGSLDACGVASTLVSTTSFGCANLGANNVSLTVTDVHGNTAVGAVVVTVADSLAPTMSGVPANISTTTPIDNHTAIVRWTAPLVADNCSATLTSSHQSGAVFPVGVTTVTLTATDPAGNRTSRSFQVTVLGWAMSASLSSPTFSPINSGSASVGYNVSCYGARTGTATVSVTGGDQPYSYLWSTGQTGATATGLPAGTHTVTVTDANGMRIVRTITLTQAPAITVTTSATLLTSFNGAQPRTLYRGYGAQSLELRGVATGGMGGYTYTWAPATGLSRTTGNTVTASPTVTTTYTLTVVDANDCTAAISQVTVVVLDVRCGNKNDKVLVCHNGHEICISANAVPAHLNGHPGDRLGSCIAPLVLGAQGASSTPAAPATLKETALLEAFPNPFANSTTVRFRQVETAAVQVRVYDGQGRVVAVLFNGVAEADREYSLVLDATPLATGIYLCRYESLGKSITQRLSVTR
ncbi:hypothetical protein GCM10011495_23220 [Hymenobacter frigidus]|uniref:HYR domain-containing protein n=1 Tax=Hymenobacter frigidus TaxID=1524095 RepID=A0ABQ2A817_9BACT|nr:nidogen-like domain-containing protein [Hymenobacter frigidus]GGH86501.1 hypothetical protein GCM10011495_23220 [Hymenobacter frigidus]